MMLKIFYRLCKSVTDKFTVSVHMTMFKFRVRQTISVDIFMHNHPLTNYLRAVCILKNKAMINRFQSDIQPSLQRKQETFT